MGAPSLASELFRTIATIAGGIVAFQLGRKLGNRSASSRNAASVAGTIIALAFAALNANVVHRAFGPGAGDALSRLGGPGTGAALGALVVIGAAWSGKSPPRRIIPALGFSIAFLFLLVLSSGSLAWRWFGASLRANYPNPRGFLTQSTPLTCGPAAASMMLADAGVRAGEGELAERAGTNPIVGTDLFALARAANALCRPRHLKCFADWTDYARVLASQRPFVAYMELPNIGGHAVYVQSITPESVAVRDPLTGSEDRMTRAVFESEWSGARLWLEPEGSQKAFGG
jgi:hypothetical protein